MTSNLNTSSSNISSESVYQMPEQYLPAVGSTCTIKTSSSPPLQQEQIIQQRLRNVYEYVPEVSFIHEEIVTTSIAPTNQKQSNFQQNRYSIKTSTTTSDKTQANKPLPKRPKVASVVPQFEEEDYEDEDEEIISNPQKIQQKVSNEKMIQNPNIPSSSQKEQNKVSGSPASTSLIEPIVPVKNKKERRKQELPSFNKKETLTSHLIFDNKPKQTSKIGKSKPLVKTKKEVQPPPV